MRILISGGGTGGGVYPALAIIAALNPAPTLPMHGEGEHRTAMLGGVLWLGSSTGPERDLVTRAGIPFQAVSSAPIAGMGWRILLAPFRIGWGLLESIGIVRNFKPDALLITGGWVTIPPALACWLMGVPVMIFCPDVEPGGTINVLKYMARKVGVVSPEAAKFYRPDQVVEAGYPVRGELLDAAGSIDHKDARKHFGLKGKEPVLLVSGGSSGARSINRAIVDHLEGILPHWQVIHVTGKLDADWVREESARVPKELATRYHTYDYLHSGEMAQALAAADVTVTRSGASVLGELPLFGLPAILVPYPHAWRTQMVNADWLASQGAAVRVQDGTLGEQLLMQLARITDASKREPMAQAMSALARPDAAKVFAEALLKLAEQRGV